MTTPDKPDAAKIPPYATCDVHGIRCDTIGCGYRDMTAPHQGETYRDYVRAVCPWCKNRSLLSVRDYLAWKWLCRKLAAWAALWRLRVRLRLAKPPDLSPLEVEVVWNGLGRPRQGRVREVNGGEWR